MRQCGSCSLCCRLLPVRSLGKAAGERCRHQRHTGCRVYAQLEQVSPECRWWNCRWLVNDDAAELSRPDRSHYVIDVCPDFVTMGNPETGAEQHVQVVQIWLDPAYPEAHRDPALRAWLLRRGAEGIAALVRTSDKQGFALFPPNMSSDGEWHEKTSAMPHTKAHTAAEVVQALGADYVVVDTSDGTA
jgi:hypothetical protein